MNERKDFTSRVLKCCLSLRCSTRRGAPAGIVWVKARVWDTLWRSGVWNYQCDPRIPSNEEHHESKRLLRVTQCCFATLPEMSFEMLMLVAAPRGRHCRTPGISATCSLRLFCWHSKASISNAWEVMCPRDVDSFEVSPRPEFCLTFFKIFIQNSQKMYYGDGFGSGDT